MSPATAITSKWSWRNLQSLGQIILAGNLLRRTIVLLQYAYYHALETVSPRLSLQWPKFRVERDSGRSVAADRTSSIEFHLYNDANSRKEFEQPTAEGRTLVTNIQNKFKTARCFICDGILTPVVQVINADDASDYIELSWCRTCDHLQYSVMPSKEWLTNWYASNWDTGGSLAAKLATRRPSYRSYRRLLPQLRSGKLKILEIGAGFGEKILPFKEAGHEIYCTEASARRASYLREHVTPNVYFGTLDDPEVQQALHENGPFDLVFTYHVVEHIYNPRQELQILRDITAEDAVLYIAIPELYKEGIINNIYTLEHIASFSRCSAKMLMADLGFEPVVCKSDPFQYYSNYCQFLIGRKMTGSVPSKIEPNVDPQRMTRYLSEALQLDRIANLPGSSFSYAYNTHAPLTYCVSEETKLKCRDSARHFPIRIYHKDLPLFWSYS